MAKRETYRTKASLEIMNYLEKNSVRTVSADDILRDLREKKLQISRATVYRQLEKLCQARVVLKYVAEKGEKAVYQLESAGRRCQEHLHLKCVNCGKILHMDCDFMDEVTEHLQSSHEFRLQCEGSVLYGECGECAKMKRRRGEDAGSHAGDAGAAQIS